MPAPDITCESIRLDARRSPAQVIPEEMLQAGVPARPPCRRGRHGARHYDRVLRWLMASDQFVTTRLSRALLEVKRRRLYRREGHARWSTYVKTFVPLTQRWVQYEMRRERELAGYPRLTAAYGRGELTRSHLRVILSRVRPKTEEVWLEWAGKCTVRQLETLVLEESKQELAASSEGSATGVDEELRARVRKVMAPPGVALMMDEAVEVARKVAGYQVGTGQAVEMMAMETLSGLPCRPESTQGPVTDGPAAAGPADSPGETSRSSDHRGSVLGDHESLSRELGRDWAQIHEHMEKVTALWSDLPWDLPEVVFCGAPSDAADAHARVRFWSALRGRLDAVRGRLLRLMEDFLYFEDVRFSSLGQYVRERMGLTLREAQDLIRLDRALTDHPLTFRMYAAGRLGRRAAWLVVKVAHLGLMNTERVWVRFAMTHTVRSLEAAVETMLRWWQTDYRSWKKSGNLPPSNRSYGELLRTCSFSDKDRPGVAGGLVSVRLVLSAEEEATYEQAAAALKDLYGRDRYGRHQPEWWCLAVMARHFLDMYADAEAGDAARRTLSRRVIRRDNYTCTAPECLQRGGLEADHIRLRSVGGPDTMENLTTLCAAHHRYIKHALGSLHLRGRAPDDLTIRMGSESPGRIDGIYRIYKNDRLVSPALGEEDLDVNPWDHGEGNGEEMLADEVA